MKIKQKQKKCRPEYLCKLTLIRQIVIVMIELDIKKQSIYNNKLKVHLSYSYSELHRDYIYLSGDFIDQNKIFLFKLFA